MLINLAGGGGVASGLTVDFTSHGMPMAFAAGNLWFVCAIGCNINVANHTNHKFPAAMPMSIPCEVKSTVLGNILAAPVGVNCVDKL